MFLDFYGLREQPFGMTADPRFLYLGPSQQEAFSALVNGIEKGRGLMALIASPGLGKTTMLLRLKDRLRASARTSLLFESPTNSLEFLRHLLADLEIEPRGQDVGELHRQLGEVLIQESRSGKRTVVAIDEAEDLEPEMLEIVRSLSNLETPGAKALQIILVGRPQLADKLASAPLEQVRQRVIVTHFHPLDEQDVPRYIDHCLRVAGYAGDGLFTPGALGMIVAHSRGIPRNINNLCSRALSLGYTRNQRRIDNAILREVISDSSFDTFGTSPEATPENQPKVEADGPAYILQGSSANPVTAEPARETAKPVLVTMKPGIVTAKPELVIVKPDQVTAKSAPGTPKPVLVTPKPVPVTLESISLLDVIDLSPHSKVESGKQVYAARDPVPLRVSSTRPARSRTRPVLTPPVLAFGLGLIIAILWWGLRLAPVLDFLKQSAGNHKISSTYEASTTTSAPVGTTSPNPQSNSVGAQPTPRNPSSPLGLTAANSLPDATAGPSGTPVEGISPKPALSSLPRSKESARESAGQGVLSARDRGYQEGKGRLVVEANVDGGRITINGRSDPKWTTPHLFSLPPGTYVVSVRRSGSLAWARRVHVDEGREQRMVADLQDHQKDGIFTVETDPPGLQIFIDGKSIGPSRVETVLPPGWHECEVIPGPGQQGLVSKFYLKPGDALIRRIRLSGPALGGDGEREKSSAANLTSGYHGGTPGQKF